MSDLPPVWSAILHRRAAGDISREVALAQLILNGGGPDLTARLEAAGQSDMARFTAAQGRRVRELADVVARGIEPAAADTPDGQVAATAALFDRLAGEAPDAAVAIYGLGDPDTMRAVTAELVGVVDAWVGVAGRRVLDFGCGTGRVAAALAPQAREVLGIDLSAGMVAEARRRHGAIGNLRFEAIADPPDAAFDLILAVDSFPFLVRAGGAVLADAFAGLARALQPGGDMLVFNWSYRGDPALDVVDAVGMADAHGLRLRRAGETPFTIWDGFGFHFARAA